MSRRRSFLSLIDVREWLLLAACGVCLGLLLAWLQKRFQLNPRLVRACLLLVGSGLLVWGVIVMIAYVKELRREEEEWANYETDDTG
jgi:hypothetical protein